MLNAIDNKLNAKGDSNYFCFMPVIIANARIMTLHNMFLHFSFFIFLQKAKQANVKKNTENYDLPVFLKNEYFDKGENQPFNFW